MTGVMRSRVLAAAAMLGAIAVSSCATGSGDGGITDYWPAPSLSSPGRGTPTSSTTYEPFPDCDSAFCTQLSINGLPVIADGACPPELDSEVVGDLVCRDGLWRAKAPG
ncbi:hypothetical protein [Gordonia rubripertincta]|uniref:Secreted protein n=1 Tax=Gordonia rubripertincta TaxID=36822 RepID=A0ABT4MP88_GORRU|nr:hypothetical protein [Gordonia rubripertincta]MCZ4548803.1 hypothetical protein [Gordonia rubripertincta]